VEPVIVPDDTVRMPEKDDPHGLMVCREVFPSEFLDDRIDRFGVPDALRYSLGRMLSHSYESAGLLGRRVVRFEVYFDTVESRFGPELYMRVHSVSKFRDVP